jgi:hypothetical protein
LNPHPLTLAHLESVPPRPGIHVFEFDLRQSPITSIVMHKA